MNNKDEDIEKYIDEIKSILPKNMKKDKIKRIENIIGKIYSIRSYKKNNFLKLKFDKSNNIYKNNINYAYFDIILEKSLRETIYILEKYNIIFKKCSFSDYIEKTQNKKQILYPYLYFMEIGKKIINSIHKNADYIYNVKFIDKKDIYEETTSSFSFKCIYIDEIQKSVNIIKNIVHIIQYNNKSCFFKIMPNSNATNKSIHLEIEIDIEQQMLNLKI